MKRLSILILLFSFVADIHSQKTNVYQSGLLGQENLQAIASLSPTSPGGMGFDNRYEGVRGSTRLFDTLLSSYMLVKGQEKYIQFESDVDVVRNTIIFRQPNTGKLMEFTSEIVNELIVIKDDRELIFRTTKGLQFEKDIRENKFCQLLLEEPHMFIKVPEKTFVEADYRAAYSADRRYDEFKPFNRYYIKGDDNIFHQVQLNRKSLVKIFPDKKEIINKNFKENINETNEDKFVNILQKL
ncbi:MAG TPA: hypothetical protein DDW27_02120 [Bacteroidales bacterium]|nr:hypothetical protein [Bacteroidales bacterium]